MGFLSPFGLPLFFFVLVKERRVEAKRSEGRLVGQSKRIQFKTRSRKGGKNGLMAQAHLMLGAAYDFCLSVVMAAMDAESCLRNPCGGGSEMESRVSTC